MDGSGAVVPGPASASALRCGCCDGPKGVGDVGGMVQVARVLRCHACFTVLLVPRAQCLTSESVQGATLALERVDDVHSGDGLAACVLGVGDGVTDHVLEEDLEDTTGLFVDESRNALDATTAGQAADGRLGDALDVVAQHLAVALGATLSESLSSLATSRHD